MKGKRNTIRSIMERLVIQESGCCVWPLALDKDGYAVCSLDGKSYRVHSLLYRHFVGPIPAGMQIDHLCRNPSCANLAHLEAVTPRENTMRGTSLAARNAAASHCIHGHPLSGENLYITAKGERQCRTCKLERKYQRRVRCPKGHPYAGENLAFGPKGHRYCRTCKLKP